MKRAIAVSALLVLCVSCHSVYIKIERRGSAGLFHPGGLTPKHFFDGHAIPLPAAPFVNCFDILEKEMPEQTCSSPPAKPEFWRKFLGYTRDQVVQERDGGSPPSWLRRSSFDEQVAQLASIRRTYAPVPSGARTRGAARAAVELVYSGEPSDLSIAVLAPVEPEREFLERFVFDRNRYNSESVVFVVEGDSSSHSGALLHDEQNQQIVLVAFEADHAFRRGAKLAIFRDLSLAEPLLSFIHISDAQIREPNATLGGQRVSARLDPLIPSFAHDYDQELYSAFIYEAFIQTINAEVEAALCDQDQLTSRLGMLVRAEEPGPRRWFRALRLVDPVMPAQTGNAPAGRCSAGSSSRRAGRSRSLWNRSYRIPPAFMIHTGDAIDAGLESEFDEFLTRSDDLRIPWYSVIGNHDVLGFGNLDLRLEHPEAKYTCTPTRRLLKEYHLRRPRKNGDREEKDAENNPAAKAFALAPFLINRICLSNEVLNDRMLAAPNGNAATPTELFIDAHCRGRAESGTCNRAHALPPALEHDLPNRYANRWRYDAGTRAFEELPIASKQNGLDITALVDAGGQDRKVGWYAFRAPIHKPRDRTWDREVWAIVLDTTSMDGGFGAIEDQQLRWLTDLLPNAADDHPIKRRDLVMVFAHHPLWGIADKAKRHQLKSTLLDAGNVIAYFAGHTHSPQLRAVGCVKGPRCDPRRRFWEVIAPATLAFPQQARQVTLNVIPSSDLAYIEVLSFEPHLEGQLQNYVTAAMRGAERDECDQYPETCVHGRPRLPENRLTYPRLFFRLPAARP